MYSLGDCSASLLRGFRAGASIHAHTHFSHENLSFLDEYTAKLPIVAKHVEAARKSYKAGTGRDLRFSDAYWTPPLSPPEVLASETRQINKAFGLEAVVSITDHDDFRAPCSLSGQVPLSTEWTVHFENTYLHLGVHNIDLRSANVITAEMHRITNGSSTVSAADLLALLQHSTDTLVVLNHPLWDVEGVSEQAHRAMVLRFLSKYREFLHALEVNGFRPWHENREVLALGSTWGLPVVAGGDRHGVTPNMLVNLTRANDFSGFAAEVRHERLSDVVLMPAYRDPNFTKQFRTAGDALGFYPTHPPERQSWPGRVFYEETPGQPRSMQEILSAKKGMPGWLAFVTAAARSFGAGPVHDTLNRILPKEKIDLPPNLPRADRMNMNVPAVHEEETPLLYSEMSKETD